VFLSRGDKHPPRRNPSLQQSLLISQGSPLVLFTRPISLVFMILSAFSIIWGIWVQLKKKGVEFVAEENDE
jgi:putative tricarboxylic transport membrane protein